MRFMLIVNKFDLFYEMTKFARSPWYEEVDFKCSPNAFGLAVCHRSPSAASCIIELQLKPQFFIFYACHHRFIGRTTSCQQFFTSFLQMKQFGFNYMTFILPQPLHDSLNFSFFTRFDLDRPGNVSLPILLPYGHNVCGPLSTTYVSFRLLQFQFMLESFNDSHVTLTVTLTNSQATFTGIDMGRDVTFILSVQRGECVIKGVAEEEESEFMIVLNPIESVKELISWKLRNMVWIYKLLNNNTHGVIIIPRELDAQYVVYSTSQ